jgi:phosphate-selective porin OprO and OprP
LAAFALALSTTLASAQGSTSDATPEAEAEDGLDDAPSLPLPAPGAAYMHPDAPPPGLHTEYGRGATFTSADGHFSLTVRGRIQTRVSVIENRDSNEVDIDFAVRRARLVFLGHLWSQDVQFYVQLGFAPLDLEPDQNIVVRDAVVTWSGLRDLNVRLGQTKVPFSRQRVISSSALQFVDRSIVNAELNLDRDIGLHLFSNDLFGLDGKLGYQLSVTGGDGRNRANRGTGLLYVARLQVQPLGAVDLADSYSEADISRGSRPRLSMGAGFGYNQDSRRTLSTHGGFFQTGSFDYQHVEVDVIFKMAGFSVQAEMLYRRADEGSRTAIVEGTELTEVSRSGLGYMIQSGYVFPSRVELAARWAQVMPTRRIETAISAYREITIASSWYVSAHNLKLQLDYGYLFGDAIGAGHHLGRLQAQVFY